MRRKELILVWKATAKDSLFASSSFGRKVLSAKQTEVIRCKKQSRGVYSVRHFLTLLYSTKYKVQLKHKSANSGKMSRKRRWKYEKPPKRRHLSLWLKRTEISVAICGRFLSLWSLHASTHSYFSRRLRNPLVSTIVSKCLFTLLSLGKLLSLFPFSDAVQYKLADNIPFLPAKLVMHAWRLCVLCLMYHHNCTCFQIEVHFRRSAVRMIWCWLTDSHHNESVSMCPNILVAHWRTWTDHCRLEGMFSSVATQRRWQKINKDVDYLNKEYTSHWLDCFGCL